MERPRVTFVTSRGSREVVAEGTLLDAARRAGLPLASSCGGRGICDACRVTVKAGRDALSPPTAGELDARLDADERLACQARAVGAATITTRYW
jgi:ferredoxin